MLFHALLTGHAFLRFLTRRPEHAFVGWCDSLRPGTHYPYVTWAHVMLRVQLGVFNIEFWRRLTLLSTLLTSRDLTWSSGRLTCQHASQISVVAHISWDVTYVNVLKQGSVGGGDIVKHCSLSVECIHVFRVVNRIISFYFLMQH
jgi:hypothetical protein